MHRKTVQGQLFSFEITFIIADIHIFTVGITLFEPTVYSSGYGFRHGNTYALGTWARDRLHKIPCKYNNNNQAGLPMQMRICEMTDSSGTDTHCKPNRKLISRSFICLE